jgi:hypothetical protein
MAQPRLTQKEISAARKAERQEEMERAIAEGRLVVRTMTPAERAASEARVAAAASKGRRRTKRR